MASKSSATDAPLSRDSAVHPQAASDLTTADPPRRQLPERVAVGLVRRPHGVRGELVVQLLSDVPGRLAPETHVEAFAPNGKRLAALRVKTRRPFKDGVLVRFDQVDDRDAADALRGASLEIDRSEVPPAPEGGFYYFELIGCRCHDRQAGELGEVVNITEDGGGHLLWVQAGKELLPIPLVRQFMADVNIAAGRIDFDLPAGLIEICRSTS